jgi:excisionase family DNA binding protein
MADRLITIQQLCDLLQVSRSTVDRWRREGLPYERIGKGGRSIRLNEDEALKWAMNKDNQLT